MRDLGTDAAKEGIAAFLEKIKAVFKNNLLNIVNKLSRIIGEWVDR